MSGNIASIAKRARTDAKEKEGEAEIDPTGVIFAVFREIRGGGWGVGVRGKRGS